MSLCLDLLETIRATVMLHSSSSHYFGKKREKNYYYCNWECKITITVNQGFKQSTVMAEAE